MLPDPRYSKVRKYPPPYSADGPQEVPARTKPRGAGAQLALAARTESGFDMVSASAVTQGRVNLSIDFREGNGSNSTVDSGSRVGLRLLERPAHRRARPPRGAVDRDRRVGHPGHRHAEHA